MADPPAAPAQGQQGQQRQNPLFGILRMIAMWYMFKTFFGGGSKKPLSREEMFMPQYAKGAHFDMSLYLSEQPSISKYSDPDALIWQEKDIAYGTDPNRALNYTYSPSKVRWHVHSKFAIVNLPCMS